MVIHLQKVLFVTVCVLIAIHITITVKIVINFNFVPIMLNLVFLSCMLHNLLQVQMRDAGKKEIALAFMG